MPARLAGRLLTSPVAFVLGGVLDVSRFLTTVAAARWRRRRAAGGAEPTGAERRETP